MNVNFFSWIRDGVKQSVLLGVSDAIETIGTPDDPQRMHPSMTALLKNNQVAASGENMGTVPRLAREGTSQKKRLGRSLKDINPAPNPSNP